MLHERASRECLCWPPAARRRLNFTSLMEPFLFGLAGILWLWSWAFEFGFGVGTLSLALELGSNSS